MRWVCLQMGLLVGLFLLNSDDALSFISLFVIYLLCFYCLLNTFFKRNYYVSIDGLILGVIILIPVIIHLFSLDLQWLPMIVDSIFGLGLSFYCIRINGWSVKLKK